VAKSSVDWDFGRLASGIETTELGSGLEQPIPMLQHHRPRQNRLPSRQSKKEQKLTDGQQTTGVTS